MMNDNDLSWIATGRKRSMFQEDYDACRPAIQAAVCDSRVLIIGGAGSIGSATIKQIVPFKPRAIHIVDTDENGLAELVRDLRCSRIVHDKSELRMLPLDYGSPIMHRFLGDQEPYDMIMNFAAVKHVRSEKDIYSILHMYETNVLKMFRFLQWASECHGPVNFFSVSTDKAANPVNLMGASKRLMEHVMFSNLPYRQPPRKVTSARFANVAFSNGSLLQSWLNRLQKRQPIAVPANTRRYFISSTEAGQLCLLASCNCPNGLILIPRMDATSDTRELQEVAVRFLKEMGYDPEVFQSESELSSASLSALSVSQYPLLVTALDTSGEKECEEFIGANEEIESVSLESLFGIRYQGDSEEMAGALSSVLKEIGNAVSRASDGISKSQLIDRLRSLMPEFHHVETVAGLDSRI